MTYHILAQNIALGGYIAIWKVIIFLILFGLWAWVGQWLNRDATTVNTNRSFWNNLYAGSVSFIILLWYILPAPFIVHVLLFVIVWAMITIIYILHRNSRVPKNETIFTRDHIKWLIERRNRKKRTEQRLVFISVNDNELPVPYPDDPEYPGYILAEEFLHDLWRRRVSAAELVPAGENYKIKNVIDGIPSVVGEYTAEQSEQCIRYLKAVAGLDIADRRKPQSGSFFTIRTGNVTTGWRIKTSGSTRGEQLQLERVEKTTIYKLNELGLHQDQIELVEKAIEKPEGIVLVSGPKGSGVTTTLYGMIHHHDAFIQNIHTLEMKPLAELDTITQNIIDDSTGETHARQLQRVIRSDPDVVMVGFCDEPDMARTGTKAAIYDNVKFYYGIEALNIFDALKSWLEMVRDKEKVAQTLVMVTCQRLIRILCDECRQAYNPDSKLLKKLNIPVNSNTQFYRPPAEVEYDKRGNPILCPKCQGTGYYGRTAVYETLFINDEIKQILKETASIKDIMVLCRREKMLYLQEQALRKVIDGTTSIQEVIRVTSEKKTTQPKKKVSAQKPKQNKTKP